MSAADPPPAPPRNRARSRRSAASLLPAARTADARTAQRYKRCMAVLQAYQTRNLAGGLLSAIRRLRRDLTRCSGCSLYPAAPGGPLCPLADYLNSAIHTTLAEIYQEWGM